MKKILTIAFILIGVSAKAQPFQLFIYNLPPTQFRDFPMGTWFSDNWLCDTRGNLPAPYKVNYTIIFDTCRKYRQKVSIAANGTVPKYPKYIGDTTVGFYEQYDEVSGDVARVNDSYMTLKVIDSRPKIYSTVNNFSRLGEVSMGVDVLMPDIYTFPDKSPRTVFRTTQEAVSFGRPVYVLLDAYKSHVHPVDEFRCLAYLAIVAGAKGLGVFEGTHETYNAATGLLEGFNLKNDYPVEYRGIVDLFQELYTSTYLSQPYKPLVSSNVAIHSCLYGNTQLIVSDSRSVETGIINGIEYVIAPLGVLIFER